MTEVDLPILDDPMLMLSKPNFSSMVLNSLYTYVLWFNLPALFLLFLMTATRSDYFSKPEKFNVRQSGLKVETKTRQPAIRKNYEDYVYGGLRRVSSILTGRLALNAPVVIVLAQILFLISTIWLVFPVSQVVSNQLIREMTLDSIDKLALHSQTDVKICADADLGPSFENNLYSDMDKIFLKEDPTEFFAWKFRRFPETFRWCSMFLMRQSAYQYHTNYIRERPIPRFMQYSLPITDVPKNKFSVSFQTEEMAQAF